MDETDTIRDSLFEYKESPSLELSTSQSLKSSWISSYQSSIVEPKQRYTNIVKNNLSLKLEDYLPCITEETLPPSAMKARAVKPKLKIEYHRLKKKYLDSENIRTQLKANSLHSRPCAHCKINQEKHRTAREVLNESIELSKVLLNEVHRLYREL